METFWHRLEKFSFKDALAIVFCGFFLCFLAGGKLEEARIILPLIGVILGAYFVSESASMWINRIPVQTTQPAQQQSVVRPAQTRPPI